MKITLKDGSVREYDKSMSVFEIASDISEGPCKSGNGRRSQRGSGGFENGAFR